MPGDKLIVKKWEDTKKMLNFYVKLELGLETIYQMSGQLILLGMAYTQTATNEGFQAVFKEGDSNAIVAFLIASNVWSLMRC